MYVHPAASTEDGACTLLFAKELEAAAVLFVKELQVLAGSFAKGVVALTCKQGGQGVHVHPTASAEDEVCAFVLPAAPGGADRPPPPHHYSRPRPSSSS